MVVDQPLTFKSKVKSSGYMSEPRCVSHSIVGVYLSILLHRMDMFKHKPRSKVSGELAKREERGKLRYGGMVASLG